MPVAALTPKVAGFFLALLPRFVVPGAGPHRAQLFLHAVPIIVTAALVEPPLVLAGARLMQALKSGARLAGWRGRSLGALFIGLGLKLATEGRPRRPRRPRHMVNIPLRKSKDFPRILETAGRQARLP